MGSRQEFSQRDRGVYVVNPKETPVYTRDAWTGVFPGMVRAPKKKKLTDYISKTILPLQKEIPHSVMDYGDLYTPHSKGL